MVALRRPVRTMATQRATERERLRQRHSRSTDGGVRTGRRGPARYIPISKECFDVGSKWSNGAVMPPLQHSLTSHLLRLESDHRRDWKVSNRGLLASVVLMTTYLCPTISTVGRLSRPYGLMVSIRLNDYSIRTTPNQWYLRCSEVLAFLLLCNSLFQEADYKLSTFCGCHVGSRSHPQKRVMLGKYRICDHFLELETSNAKYSFINC